MSNFGVFKLEGGVFDLYILISCFSVAALNLKIFNIGKNKCCYKSKDVVGN